MVILILRSMLNAELRNCWMQTDDWRWEVLCVLWWDQPTSPLPELLEYLILRMLSSKITAMRCRSEMSTNQLIQFYLLPRTFQNTKIIRPTIIGRSTTTRHSLESDIDLLFVFEPVIFSHVSTQVCCVVHLHLNTSWHHGQLHNVVADYMHLSWLMTCIILLIMVPYNIVSLFSPREWVSQQRTTSALLALSHRTHISAPWACR